jgi:hypothetical protein
VPIRFYCPFCERLLGISSRRVGEVVECPSCGGKVGVPSPDAPPAPLPVQLVPPPPRPGHLVLGCGQLVALSVVLLLLAGVAFVAGMLVGALG